ncbi:MAG: hypothetical protein AUK34_06915 [Ignavibacteria bacterium CG2_30_36_16]|jgi:hypothetical protein|nr:hypothetical protein [Ignavibacteria bacterium]OIP60076.1 MAG: hypothetical protein AUK34_06915 [Ignavibacteria bacterium CG2_30_36_16]PJB01147.1 MAG: hypothetical protein CO127_05380 [Ignavibacteria bacterium CG_4_9_14_3_um_filter_36_18]
MNSNTFNPRFWVLTGMIIAAAFFRFLPHPPNFVPIAAMALFGGAYFSNKKLAFLVPFAAMIISDMVIGFHSVMWAVYLSFALIVVIGMSVRRNKKAGSIILASVSASVSFFVITNFAHWLIDPIYAKTGSGLAACYIAAVPFFHYTLLGDLFFVGVMFGAYELVKIKFPVLQEVKA